MSGGTLTVSQNSASGMGISRGYLYSLWRRGQGPRFMQVGDRRIITREAGADWRRELEVATELQPAE
jgi:hypothetical protein